MTLPEHCSKRDCREKATIILIEVEAVNEAGDVEITTFGFCSYDHLSMWLRDGERYK
ncbi:MAG TPA: hypothetical protein VGS11_10955 [Candidatus Bathyarchaeia archaeon]|nr:hypothetical protein [Candidatus Bathyarchaeia archaeon]